MNGQPATIGRDTIFWVQWYLVALINGSIGSTMIVFVPDRLIPAAYYESLSEAVRVAIIILLVLMWGFVLGHLEQYLFYRFHLSISQTIKEKITIAFSLNTGISATGIIITFIAFINTYPLFVLIGLLIWSIGIFIPSIIGRRLHNLVKAVEQKPDPKRLDRNSLV